MIAALIVPIEMPATQWISNFLWASLSYVPA